MSNIHGMLFEILHEEKSERYKLRFNSLNYKYSNLRLWFRGFHKQDFGKKLSEFCITHVDRLLINDIKKYISYPFLDNLININGNSQLQCDLKQKHWN